MSQLKTRSDPSSDSPTLVLEEEENPELNDDNGDSSTLSSIMEEEKQKYLITCFQQKVEGPNVPEEAIQSNEGQCTKLDDTSLVSSIMEEVEERLFAARVQEELKEENVPDVSPTLNDGQFTKLDELLTQTQLFSEFLLEKIEEDGTEQHNSASVKQGRSTSKRKATSQYNTGRAKRVVNAMLTRSKSSSNSHDISEKIDITEEELVERQQAEFVPLLTGGRLKSYQLKGVKWLVSLWKNGLNGILADQMGLGKTIQTIGLLAHLKGNNIDGPFMIIAPLSTLSNWINEISRFAPSLNSVIYHGDKQQRNDIRRKQMPLSIGSQFPIIITSYEVALADSKKYLTKYPWKYVIVDEGHRLKNSNCKLFKHLEYLKAENKLLLTGTPLQNNLAELWSLLHFILPDIFQSLEEFKSWFDLSGKSSGEASKETDDKRIAKVVEKLHAILRPFLLRRLKSDVEKLLPQKKEIILYATMTECQRNFQDHLVNKSLENYLAENVYSVAGRGMKGRLNNLMVQLRKNCNHPDLLESAFDGSYMYPPLEQIVEQCGKFKLLDRLLSKLIVLEHKVLIFSQSTKVLDLMDYYFSEKGFEVCRIDGTVKLDERKRQIEAFNDVNSEYKIFLLSTRAGGLGINLTAADTCIIYDSDWNPQMDLQAMDRCHRIGQTKPVHVYRLATAQSIEVRVLKRAFSKLRLEHVVIGKGQFLQDHSKLTSCLEAEDIISLLRDDESAEEKWIQTDVSDEDLERILDRRDLLANVPIDKRNSDIPTIPLKGPGWEVVIPTATGGGLNTLND